MTSFDNFQWHDLIDDLCAGVCGTFLMSQLKLFVEGMPRQVGTPKNAELAGKLN